VDITVAPDFPKAAYMEVEERLSKYLSDLNVDAGTVAGFRGYAGGWNAIILRYRSADDDCMLAAQSLAKYQGGLSTEERYQQERPLFAFFCSAQSAIESCCFGIYHIGCLRNPGGFTRKERAVTPEAAHSDFAAAYPGSVLTNELGLLVDHATWKEIKHIRRILFHRMHPGITIFVSAGGPPPPPAEWTTEGIKLEPALVNDPRAWLATATTRLVEATLDFVKTNF
jgi:hypothetical protein